MPSSRRFGTEERQLKPNRSGSRKHIAMTQHVSFSGVHSCAGAGSEKSLSAWPASSTKSDSSSCPFCPKSQRRNYPTLNGNRVDRGNEIASCPAGVSETGRLRAGAGRKFHGTLGAPPSTDNWFLYSLRERYAFNSLHGAAEYAILLFVGLGRRIVLKPAGSSFICF